MCVCDVLVGTGVYVRCEEQYCFVFYQGSYRHAEVRLNKKQGGSTPTWNVFSVRFRHGVCLQEFSSAIIHTAVQHVAPLLFVCVRVLQG